MKRLVLITRQQETLRCFDIVNRSRSFELEIRETPDWKKLIAENGSMVYLDIGSMSPREARKAIRILESQDTLAYGIVDPKGMIEDPGDLFHGGASDYIGPELTGKRLSMSRINQALSFYPYIEDEEEETEDLSWENIREGEEYPFYLLYAELDILPEWKKKSGSSFITGLLNTFENHLNRIALPLGGQLWMKSNYGGLYLFPYSEGSTDIIPACMRMILNRVLISMEVFSYGTLLPYHFSLDTGTTVYRKKGNTGTLISDAVNFIFHLGQQYTQPGQFILSSRAAEHIPAGLADCFAPCGTYHDQHLLRMKMPK
ncbi:hypothetical protein [Marispirochaeta sp.]|jgi:hypothetical protein|uniref:hypothetical protein n=1 Tax=Marispirochaeta sp. TaxID=2038653 RepID=UPI0029C72447|nr:hypothetical protein [Marispirochaeta sp.]